MEWFIMFLVFCGITWGDPALIVTSREQLPLRLDKQVSLPKQEIAPNKVPVVDIAQSNTAGVSHNYYEKFNVNREGLILNNSTVAAQSQLGGMLMGNANLARTGSANLIVNEVVGPTQSQINGFVEVHGKAADLVVANPNGISVNGGGFINAPKVTLTTGVPEFDANGGLQSLLVQQGKVSIGEQGMHVQNCNYCDILANAVEINGAIQGQKSEHEGTDMHVVSGYYRFDYPARIATEEGNGTPIMGVDSAALGGMYAGKIYFQAKGKDVGVKLPLNMVTNTGDLVVEADGSIHLAGYVNSTGKIDIKASNKISIKDANIQTSDKFEITAKDAVITNTKIYTLQTLSLNATDVFRSSESRLNSEKALHIQAGSMESTKDHFASLEPICLESVYGDLSLKRTMIQTPLEARLHSTGNLALNGRINTKRWLNLTSNGTLHQEGVLEVSGGGITAQSSADALIKGKWTARDDIRIGSNASVEIKNHSLLSSEGPISVNATHKASLAGTIRTKDKATFIGNIGVISGNISGKNVTIETTETLQMTGEIYANEQLQVRSKKVDITEGKLRANQNLVVSSTAEDLILNSLEMETPMNIVLNSARDIAFDGSLKTNEAIHLEAQQDVRVKGAVQGRTAKLRAQKNLSVEPMSDVKVAEALGLEATKEVDLQGQSQSGTLAISGENIHIAGQHISQGKIDISAQNEAKIQGALVLVADGIDIKADSSLETDGILNAKNDVALVTQSLTQSGGIFSREGGVRIRTKQSKLFGNLLGTTGLELQSEDVINLEDTTQIASEGPIGITSEEVHLAGKLETEGSIEVEAEILELKPKLELSGRTLTLNQTSDRAVQWDNITLQSNQQISVKSLGNIKISGSVLSSGDVMFESDKNMDLKSTDSRIAGKTTLKARNMLSLSGLLVGLSSMLFSAKDIKVQPQAQIESPADVTIDTGEVLTIQPDCAVVGKDLSIKSPTVTNEGLLQGSDSVSLNIVQQLTNDGQVLSDGRVAITTPLLRNNGRIQSSSGEFTVANLSNAGSIWISGPLTTTGDKIINTGWMRMDGPWNGKFNTFENQAGWVKGATVDFKDPMHWFNKARMDFSSDVLLPLSTFENVSASFYSGGDVVVDVLRNVNEKEPKVGPFRKFPKLCRWYFWGYGGYKVETGDRVTYYEIYSNEYRHVDIENWTGYTDFVGYDYAGHSRNIPGEVSWKEIVYENSFAEEDLDTVSDFRVQQNLQVRRIENNFSRLNVGKNFTIGQNASNKGAGITRKK